MFIYCKGYSHTKRDYTDDIIINMKHIVTIWCRPDKPNEFMITCVGICDALTVLCDRTVLFKALHSIDD